MVTIVVLGANGQVGLEVCLFLNAMTDVTVVPVVRSELGAALLERCGIKCRIGALSDHRHSSDLLEGANLVVDFRLPTGLPSQVKRSTRGGIKQCIGQMPRSCTYAYISSTMAFGMGDVSAYPKYSWYTWSRSSYAAYKRYAERYTRWYGRTHRRPTYILRLGQVFGELQGIARLLLQRAEAGPVSMPDAGRVPSDAVFCSTIALALRNIAAGDETPGTYTVVESPDWSWSDVYALHAAEVGVPPRLEPTPVRVSSPAKTSLRAIARGLLSRKELLVAHILPQLQSLQMILKARNLLRLAASDIAAGKTGKATAMISYAGPVPGARLRHLTNSWTTMQPLARDVRRVLDDRLGPRSHNYRGAIWTPAA